MQSNAFYRWVMALTLSTGITLQAAQNATIRLFCESVHIQRGTEPNGEYTLYFTATQQGLNNELPPDFVGESTHYGNVFLHDELFEGYIPGAIQINVPDGGDANDDGFGDFFDTSQAINAQTSSGSYAFQGFGNGVVQASWTRAAGAASGTCVFNFRPDNLFIWKTFTHTFTILEYRGTLAYSAGATNFNGMIELSQVDLPSNTLQGPVQVNKPDYIDRFDLLILRSGNWTNSSDQILSFYSNYLSRDTERLTNYYGFMDFYDGEPNTGEPDFLAWTISLDDTNDVDADGIPDFSDDVAPIEPTLKPTLRVELGATNIVLSIEGTVGRLHIVQESNQLNPVSWTDAHTISLTNSPQVLTLPLSDVPKRFWRVKLQ